LRPTVLLAIASVVACRAPEDAAYFGTTTPRHGPNELWINNSTEPEWLDPGKLSDGAGSEITWNLFAGLLQYHPTTLEPMPDLATRWEVTDQGRRYVFHLREARWSDGHPLEAEDFVWSWRRVLRPSTGAKYATMFYVLENGAAFHQRAVLVEGLEAGTSTAAARAILEKIVPIDRVLRAARKEGFFVFVQGEKAEAAERREKLLRTLRESDGLKATIATADVVGVRALDPRTLEVRLESAIPYFIHLMPFYSWLPVPRHVIEGLQNSGANPDLWTRPEHIVTSGPYVLTEWKFRQHMIFKKNPNYWDASRVKLEKIKVLMVESYNTTLNLYRTGEVDWIGRNANLPAEFMQHLEPHKDFRRSPLLSVYFYWLNTRKPPLDDVKVRRALSLAVDRESLVKYVTRAGQLPTADLVPDGLAGYRGLKRPIFDPEQARALLAESKYGGSIPKIVLSYNTSEGHKQIAEAIQQMWKKHLGLEVEIENQEWNIFLKNMQLMNHHIARFGWNGDYPDPYTFLELFLSNNGNNHSGWVNARYDALLHEASSTTIAADRLAIMREAEGLAMDELPLIPLYVYTRSQMVKPYVRGFWSNYFDRHPWKYLSIDERRSESEPEPPPGREFFER
jgi:oligopeptide transport system substrate-binding protein